MATTEKNPARRVRTPEFRMSFPSLLKPRQNDEGPPKYELTMLFPPGSDMKPLQGALRAAMEDQFGPDQKRWPKLRYGMKEVIRDFDEYNSNSNKPMAGDWKGWTMVRARATEKYPPQVVPATKNANGTFDVITDEREVYGGRWGKAVVEAFVYERKDGKGVSFGLGNVQLLKHDKKFSGAVSAPEQDFENEDVPADEFDSGAKASSSANDSNDW